MHAFVSGLKRHLGARRGARDRYVRLRRHLDKQPVGFPATPTGVELRLLEEIFTPEEAEVALLLDYRFVPFETVCERAGGACSPEGLQGLLDSMEGKGCLFVRRVDGKKQYALHPFVIGMFEMQIRRMTPSFYLDTRDYVVQRFGIEYLTTEVPQMRVIPIRKSVTAEHNVATYDEIRSIVERAGDRISVADCICKTGWDLIGRSCERTDRREICLGFRDFADTYVRQGWGRKVSREEALEILDQSEKDGLMLLPSTMQSPQFVCSCCGCCCGIIEMISLMPRPADFAASNYQARLDPGACNGCGRCTRRCPMGAIVRDEQSGKAVAVDLKRCVGCGLCVAACKTGALTLVEKPDPFVPPEDHEALMERIMAHKKSTPAKLLRMGRALLR